LPSQRPHTPRSALRALACARLKARSRRKGVRKTKGWCAVEPEQGSTPRSSSSVPSTGCKALGRAAE
jgi:hypothetical protein